MLPGLTNFWRIHYEFADIAGGVELYQGSYSEYHQAIISIKVLQSLLGLRLDH
jgi:hypothetical protein